MLEAIVFDFDGVIVDSEPLHYRAFLEVLKPLGVRFDYVRYHKRYIGFDDRDGFRAMCDDQGVALDDDRLAELIAEKACAFQRIVGAGVPPFAGVVELIEEAAEAMPIAIASGALRSDVDAILAGLGGGGLAERFEAVVTAEDVRQSKPDPESYAMTVRRLGVTPGSALAIEDTPAGLISARAAGLRTLGVTNSCAAEDLSRAERVVDSLLGVTVKRLQQWYGKETPRLREGRR